MMKNLAVLALAAGGCVLAPTDDGTVASRHAPIAFSGYASAPSKDLELRSWNYQRSAWELVRAFRSTTTAVGSSPPIYGWSTTVPLIGNRYWVPPGAPCATGGMARFEVRERQTDGWLVFKTFDQAGRTCLNDELAAGTDPAAAGSACYTGENVLVFAPDACVTAPASDGSAPALVLRATDDARTWEVRPGDLTVIDPIAIDSARPLRLRADGHDPHGLYVVQIDWEAEVTCRLPSGVTGIARGVFRAFDPPIEPVIAPGARVAASFGAAVDPTIETFRSMCTGGSTPRSAIIRARAIAWSRHATPATTPALAFNKTF